jgi:glutaredoxin
MTITIYATGTCPFCSMLKSYLTEKGKTFSEKLVDTDEVAREEMMAASGGFLGVPFTVVTRDDGTKETVMGFDKGKIDSILGITG